MSEDTISYQDFLNGIHALESVSIGGDWYVQVSDYWLIVLYNEGKSIIDDWYYSKWRHFKMWLRGWREDEVIKFEKQVNQLSGAVTAAIIRESNK